jgi:hypothetical protein
MSFRIGQRVRAVHAIRPETIKHLGATGTIVGGTMVDLHGVLQPVRWDADCALAGAWAGRIGDEPVKCLAPIDDPKGFASFMERVLKPLPQEVLA